MHNLTTIMLSDLTEALTIHAFDRFVEAAHRADLPLPAINAFATYRTAVDCLLEALEASSRGDVPALERQAVWGLTKLIEMDGELSKLVSGERH